MLQSVSNDAKVKVQMRLPNLLLLASSGVLFAAAACTLITDVDRSKIPDGAAGVPGNNGGDGNKPMPGFGGVPSNGGEGGSPTTGTAGDGTVAGAGGVDVGGTSSGGAASGAGGQTEAGAPSEAGASGAAGGPVL